ncbi:MAG: SocA family protein [Zoogloeaceae bacterium]|nr:SocA family protein [Zoogloeaceae bacterium]
MKTKNPLFDERRTAEAAVCLLWLAGGSLPIIKLMKLLYLAERLSLQRYGVPITGDKLVSMPHGPVLSMTYELIQGMPSAPGGWEDWISARENHQVALADSRRIRSLEDLRHLCDADLETLEDIWREFGHMKPFDLVDYTHNNCPEWRDPHGSSRPISYGDLFNAVGYTPEQARIMADELKAQQYIAATFA